MLKLIFNDKDERIEVGTIGDMTEITDRKGRKLYVGDEVTIYNGEEVLGRNVPIIKDEECPQGYPYGLAPNPIFEMIAEMRGELMPTYEFESSYEERFDGEILEDGEIEVVEK